MKKFSLKGLDFLHFLLLTWKEKSKPRYGRVTRRAEYLVGVLIAIVCYMGYQYYELKCDLDTGNRAYEIALSKRGVELDALQTQFQRLTKLGAENFELLTKATSDKESSEIELEKSTLRIEKLNSDIIALKSSLVSVTARSDSLREQVSTYESFIYKDKLDKENSRRQLLKKYKSLTSNQ